TENEDHARSGLSCTGGRHVAKLHTNTVAQLVWAVRDQDSSMLVVRAADRGGEGEVAERGVLVEGAIEPFEMAFQGVRKCLRRLGGHAKGKWSVHGGCIGCQGVRGILLRCLQDRDVCVRPRHAKRADACAEGFVGSWPGTKLGLHA